MDGGPLTHCGDHLFMYCSRQRDRRSWSLSAIRRRSGLDRRDLSLGYVDRQHHRVLRYCNFQCIDRTRWHIPGAWQQTACSLWSGCGLHDFFFIQLGDSEPGAERRMAGCRKLCAGVRYFLLDWRMARAYCRRLDQSLRRIPEGGSA
jgi:hypothetical protein